MSYNCKQRACSNPEYLGLKALCIVLLPCPPVSSPSIPSPPLLFPPFPYPPVPSPSVPSPPLQSPPLLSPPLRPSRTFAHFLDSSKQTSHTLSSPGSAAGGKASVSKIPRTSTNKHTPLLYPWLSSKLGRRMAEQPGTILAEQNLPAFCKPLHPLHA